MKHFIFISIILILIIVGYFFLKDKVKTCGPKPGAPGKWICKNGNWIKDLNCGPKPAIGNYRCMAGKWVNMNPENIIKDFNTVVLKPNVPTSPNPTYSQADINILQ